MQKPLAVEATVFWLIVTAIVELTAHPTSETPGVARLGAIVIGARDSLKTLLTC